MAGLLKIVAASEIYTQGSPKRAKLASCTSEIIKVDEQIAVPIPLVQVARNVLNLKEKVLTPLAKEIVRSETQVPEGWPSESATQLLTLYEANKPAIRDASDPSIVSEVEQIKKDLDRLILVVNTPAGSALDLTIEIDPSQKAMLRAHGDDLKKAISLIRTRTSDEQVNFIMSLTSGGVRQSVNPRLAENGQEENVNCGTLLIPTAILVIEKILEKNDLGVDVTPKRFVSKKLQNLRLQIAREILVQNLTGGDIETVMPRFCAQCNNLNLGIEDKFNYIESNGRNNLEVIPNNLLLEEFNKRYSPLSITAHIQQEFTKVLELAFSVKDVPQKSDYVDFAQKYHQIGARALLKELPLYSEADELPPIMGEYPVCAQLWVVASYLGSESFIGFGPPLSTAQGSNLNFSEGSALSFLDSGELFPAVVEELSSFSPGQLTTDRLHVLSGVMASFYPTYSGDNSGHPTFIKIIDYLTSSSELKPIRSGKKNIDISKLRNADKRKAMNFLLQETIKRANTNELISMLENPKIVPLIKQSQIKMLIQRHDLAIIRPCISNKLFDEALSTYSKSSFQRVLEHCFGQNERLSASLLRNKNVRAHIMSLKPSSVQLISEASSDECSLAILMGKIYGRESSDFTEAINTEFLWLKTLYRNSTRLWPPSELSGTTAATLPPVDLERYYSFFESV
jgi:hypothetical protein